MGQRYSGRHRDAATIRVAHQRARHRLAARVVRRPLVTAGAAVALVGVSAAGYAKAGEPLSNLPEWAAAIAVPSAATQADERKADHDAALVEQSSYREAATRASAIRASYAADQAKAVVAAAAVKAKAAAGVQAAAISAERQAEADRAARDAQRVALIDNARSDPRLVARAMLGDHGWSDGQWSCLEQLWVGESDWNYKAENPSGAYGIPQSLPASKMASVGADYRTNPITQITWGMDYIKNSYGSPCSALSSWNSRSPHWY